MFWKEKVPSPKISPPTAIETDHQSGEVFRSLLGYQSKRHQQIAFRTVLNAFRGLTNDPDDLLPLDPETFI